MCAALATDASVLVLKVSICLPCFQVAIQKRLGSSLLVVSEIMLCCYSTFFEYTTTTTPTPTPTTTSFYIFADGAVAHR